MKFKNILLVLFIIATSILMYNYVFAEENPILTVSDVTVDKAVGEFDVTLSVNNNPGIVSAKITIDYDDKVFTLIDVKDADVWGSTSHSPSFVSPYNLYWINGTIKDNFTNNGVVATLRFKLNDNTKCGNYSINVNYEDDNILNVNMDNVYFETKNGNIEIIDALKEKDTTTQTPITQDDKKDEIAVDTSGKLVTDNINNQIILTINSKEILVFGKTFLNDVAPIIRNNRTMLPIRMVAENLGATVEWFTDEQKVTIERDDLQISVFINSNIANVNNNDFILDSSAFIENDRTYLPVRFISEALKASVDWDEKNQKVIITK